MNEKIQDASGKVSARRRLIRGAFAAPAVMTLYSGGAFAATSNAERCIANNVKPVNQQFPTGITSTAVWLKVPRYKLKTGASSYTYWVKGLDVNALKGTNTSLKSHLQNADFQQVFLTDNAAVTVQASSPTAMYNNKTQTLQSDSPNFVAVRVNGSGDIVGIVNSGPKSSTSAIAGTCWTSFTTGVSI